MKINTRRNIEFFSQLASIDFILSEKILTRLNSGGEENSPRNLTREFNLGAKSQLFLADLISGVPVKRYWVNR